MTPTTRTLFWLAVAGAGALGVFVLPFAFPPHVPVYSAAYIAGDNNRVASLTLAGLSVVVAAACWWWGLGRPAQTSSSKLDRRWLVTALTVMLLFTATLGGLIVRAHVYWGDAGYFYNQLRSGLVFHRVIYRDFEFPYGPLLYWWPAVFVTVIGKLGISMGAAYMVSVAAMQAAGLALLFYILQALPMPRGLKLAAFVLITIGFLTPIFGINYTALRFVLPFATVVLLARQQTVAAAACVACLGEMLQFADSPEMAVAFGGALAAYSLYAAFARSLRWLYVLASGAVGAGLFALLAGPVYFLTLGRLAKGEYNLIVEPLPHLLLLCFAALVLAPLAVAPAVRANRPEAGMLLAFFVASLALLAPALGRCDPLHAFCNGLGLYLLSFVAVGQASQPWQRAWIATFALLVVFTQTVNIKVYATPLHLVLQRTPPDPAGGIDITALQLAIGRATVTAPFLAPQAVLDSLSVSGQYRPDYFCGMLTVWDAEAEEQKIAEMRHVDFALVPTEPVRETEPIDNTRIKRLERFGFVYNQRNAPFYIGPPIYSELSQHWTPVGRFSAFTLFRRVS